MKNKSKFVKRPKKQFPVTSDVCIKLLAENTAFRMATDVKSMVIKKVMYARIKANSKKPKKMAPPTVDWSGFDARMREQKVWDCGKSSTHH